MPKRSAPDFRSKKYELFNLDLSRTAVQLIALLIADQPLKNTCVKYGLYNLLEDSLEIEDNIVIRMTVELATGYRLVHWSSKYHQKTDPVGYLWPQVEVDKSETLSILEACNKIIHANELEFAKRKVRGFGADYLKPHLAVTGEKGKNTWEAHIDMLLFCNEVLSHHTDFKPFSSQSAKPPNASEA